MGNIKSLKTSQDSPVNGTDDREAYPRHWIAALVQMNMEKKTAQKLEKLGYECYVPTQTEIHQWSDRKKKIQRIVIPMVIFVCVGKSDEKELKKFSYIHKFVSYPGKTEAAIIPATQLDQLKFMLGNATSNVFIEKHLHLGDKVRVLRGPLKGLEGELTQLKDKKQAVAISLESLGFACLEIPMIEVEVIKEKKYETI